MSWWGAAGAIIEAPATAEEVDLLINADHERHIPPGTDYFNNTVKGLTQCLGRGCSVKRSLQC